MFINSRQKYIKESLTFGLNENLKECEYEFNEKKGELVLQHEGDKR